MTTVITPDDKHINFVKSYLIKTEEELSIINLTPNENSLTLHTDLGEFELLNFPKDYSPFINFKKVDGENHTIILAVPEPLKGWNPSE